MNRKWTTYNFGRSLKMLSYFVTLMLMFGTLGCAMLQETPPVEISASQLTCEKNPAMVDGQLETVGIFEAHGIIQKGFRNQRQYQRQVIGNLKTETLIKLDAPMYIAYVDVYPASTIPRFALDTTAEEQSSKWQLSFEAVEDKRGEAVKSTQPVRFQIGREILYLRLTAYVLEDSKNVGVYSETAIKEMEASLKAMNTSPEATEKLRQRWQKQKREGEMQIPLKGAAIREIKFYGRQ